MTPTVAALFVDRHGPYPRMPAVDWWDEKRDARRYAGPYPVVAHPPCARWCKLAKFVESQHGYKVGDDGGMFASALAAVRKYGGVLEHPAWSLAWPAFGLLQPLNGGWAWQWTPYGIEWVCAVAQSAYGLEARKLTWLLVSGFDPPNGTNWSRPRGTKSLTYFSQRHPGDFNTSRSHGERMTSSELHLTPPAFAQFLVSIARSKRIPRELGASP
jgi:hypothetical protein